MSNENKTSSGSPAANIIVGVVLMVAGGWVSQNVQLAFVENLGKQGIPLDPGKTVSVIGMFLILFPVIKAFFINPLSEAINHRTVELEKTFSEAEDLRAEMTKMRSDYEARLAATEADAREKIQAQIKEAQTLRQTLMSEASAKADEFLKRAQEEIEGEKQRAITDLRVSVVDLTLQATEKVLGENMNTERNRKLVTEFIDKVEAGR